VRFRETVSYPTAMGCALLALVATCGRSVPAEGQSVVTDPPASLWLPLPAPECWQVGEGTRVSAGQGQCLLLLREPAVTDGVVTVAFRVLPGARANVGVVVRSDGGGNYYYVRRYDARAWLELIQVQGGTVVRPSGDHWLAHTAEGSAPVETGRWYWLKVALFGDEVWAKVWPRGEGEPPWELKATVPERQVGLVGLVTDETAAEFGEFRLEGPGAVAELRRQERRQQVAAQRRQEEVRLCGEGGPYLDLTVSFDRVSPHRTAEVVFRAADATHCYFARHLGEMLTVGRVDGDTETALARAPVPGWQRGELRVRVRRAGEDGAGRAWYLNERLVPAPVTIHAGSFAEGGGEALWQIVCRDDPVVPGPRGGPYWLADPIGAGVVRSPLDTQWGVRERPGVTVLDTRLQAHEPPGLAGRAVSPLRTIRTGGRGGCWLALGDVDDDGRLDFVVARNEDQHVRALTAYDVEGRVLWEWGGGGSPTIGYDVPAIVYDLEGDGRQEVLFSADGRLMVLEGATGRRKRWAPLPAGLAVADCIMVANLSGARHPHELLIKSRYDQVWALNRQLEVLWTWKGNTGHHPAVADIDGDGRDEVLAGYTLLDHDGSVMASVSLGDHADTCRFVTLADGRPALLNGCGDAGMVLWDVTGQILWRLGPPEVRYHFQSIHLGNLRPGRPGDEFLVDDGWAPPGRSRAALIGADGTWLGAFTSAYPRFFRLVDWDGDGVQECLFPADGVVCDAEGDVAVRLEGALPLGGPGTESPMAHVADVWGDGRDEIILFNAEAIQIFSNPEPADPAPPPQPVVQARYYNATYY